MRRLGWVFIALGFVTVVGALSLLRQAMIDEPQPAIAAALVPDAGPPAPAPDPKIAIEEKAPEPDPEDVQQIAKQIAVPKRAHKTVLAAREMNAPKDEAEAEPVHVTPEGLEEARRVMEMVDRMQRAPDDSLPGMVQSLRGIACSIAPVSSARDRCADAYEKLIDGAARQDKVEQEIVKREKTTSPREELAALKADLAKAEDSAESARANVVSCEQNLHGLAKKYGFATR
jgi:hypothetical protein